MKSCGGSGGLPALLSGLLLSAEKRKIVGDLVSQGGADHLCLRPAGTGLFACQQSGGGKTGAAQGKRRKQIELRRGEFEKYADHTADGQQGAANRYQRRGDGGGRDAVQPCAAAVLVARVQRMGGPLRHSCVRVGLSVPGSLLRLLRCGLRCLRRGALALQPNQRVMFRQRSGGKGQPFGTLLRLLCVCLRLCVFLRGFLPCQLLP